MNYEGKMNNSCRLSNSSSKTRLDEILSWRLLKKNPSGALIWGIFGVAIVMDSAFFVHFLKRKEYQVLTRLIF